MKTTKNRLEEKNAKIMIVKKFIKAKKINFANWQILRIMNISQRKQYVVYAAVIVDHIWKDTYPKEYKIWKDWIDSGCPNGAVATKLMALEKVADKATLSVPVEETTRTMYAQSAAMLAAATVGRLVKVGSVKNAEFVIVNVNSAIAWSMNKMVKAESSKIVVKILEYGIGILKGDM